MVKNEDVLPEGYQYKWTKDSELSLQEFLNKYKPSMVQNDGTKPWIWIQKSEPEQEDKDRETALEEASALLKDITEKIESIKNDTSIPARSSKKTGAKGKKEVREEAQADATAKLKDTAVKHGYVSGKWLVFASAEKVDAIWSQIATSLVSGPLSTTSAFLAKVATSPQADTPNYQHLICVYIPHVYDKDKATEIMKVLLRNHGLNLSGAKSNLYTDLGIDSKHASGLQSTIWKNAALMDEKEMKALKDAYFAALAANKPTDVTPVVETAKAGKAAVAAKAKPKLKKRVEDDPFASGDDEDESKASPRDTQPSKKGKTGTKRKQNNDDSDEPRPKKKFTV